MHDILLPIWFFIPAGAANAAPVFAAHIPLLKKFTAPMDGGKTFRGQRVFGANKTWRGLIAGMLLATAVLALQQYLFKHTQWATHVSSPINYYVLPLWLLGPLFGFGALIGDAIESFFKRQHHVPSGHSWFPFDQIDYIIGGAIAVAPLVRLELRQYVWLIISWLVLHLMGSYVGYLLKLKDRPI
jgi:CDP-2,3-bis-(O-geranylgeranyl)-sn-glycerol synthase